MRRRKRNLGARKLIRNLRRNLKTKPAMWFHLAKAVRSAGRTELLMRAEQKADSASLAGAEILAHALRITCASYSRKFPRTGSNMKWTRGSAMRAEFM